jgi:soluble lytic murein transglycosylase-like protein
MRVSRPLTVVLVCLASGLLSCQLVPVSPGASPAELAPPRQPTKEEIRRVETYFVQRSSGLRPAEIDRVAETVVVASRRAGFSPDLVLAVIQVESSGHNFAVSSAGALGLMQLRPATAEAIAHRIGVHWSGPATLFDPVANVQLGVAYLKEMVLRFGSLKTALAAYNWGPTHIGKRLRRGEPIPVVYAHRVMTGYRSASSET